MEVMSFYVNVMMIRREVEEVMGGRLLIPGSDMEMGVAVPTLGKVCAVVRPLPFVLNRGRMLPPTLLP